ncbi:NAD(P)-dependent oxidoreductase [Thalassomonas actiniarum]|uniref:NAD(P)-dependent oxidoreductase n=1 Tax=Thalassomonas actiniarum TaxID=485447 RepID=A0AAE9YRZ1_9GAMM|nr:NAD(P)-dependent oxidoreductase [Thalassomonas actiniarum]WDD99975.1 NAD(P)-dependent oxidoreductase [Thalassomonas actiniarum]
MKIAILGATGWIGSTIMNEALNRQHQVIAISRDTGKIEQDGVQSHTLDLLAQGGMNEAVTGADVVIAAVGGRAQGNHEMVSHTAKRLLAELPQAGIKRLIWVGGAGSLEVAPGVKLVTVPEFPAEYKDEALAQGQALDIFRQSDSPLDWLFVSPAAEIFPGERSGKYRLGGDQLLTDSEGKSKVSVQDYAVALLDQAEKAEHHKTRIAVAY